MQMNLPNQFFTDQQALYGCGCVCNRLRGSELIQAAFNFNPRWLALLVSEIIAVYGTYASRNAHVPSDYFLSILNGCLILALPWAEPCSLRLRRRG